MLMCREIVKRIDMWGIDMVFVVGGNGGNAGAAAIQAQCEKDGVVCNIVGVPKSIDNDILVVSHYFSYKSCIAAGCCSECIKVSIVLRQPLHTEASVSLVKLFLVTSPGLEGLYLLFVHTNGDLHPETSVCTVNIFSAVLL